MNQLHLQGQTPLNDVPDSIFDRHSSVLGTLTHLVAQTDQSWHERVKHKPISTTHSIGMNKCFQVPDYTYVSYCLLMSGSQVLEGLVVGAAFAVIPTFLG